MSGGRIIVKTETTVLGIEKVEIYSFPHKTFKEFFAALWLAVKYSDEKLKLYQIIKSWKHLSEYEILIRFICGLIPEAGMELWMHVTEQDIWQKGRGVPHFLTSFDESNKIQTLILQAMKEARDCGDKQAEQVYYQSPAVVIDGRTSEEDKTLLCNMMEYYSDTKYSQATVKNANLSKTLYQSILSSVSHASFIQVLKLGDISSSNECISLLDLQYNQVLKALTLNKLPATDLRLPSDSNSHPLGSIILRELVLTHASLEKLCNSLSDLSHVKYMKIANLTCRDHSCSKTCCLFVLDLHSHHELCDVELCQLPLRDMILPSVDHSQPPELNLCDLVFSTKTLGQLCTYLSGWLDLADVKLSSFLGRDKSCGNTCCLSVLDLLSRHGLQKLDSNRLPLNDSILPSDNELKPSDLTLCDLVLSHKGLEHLCNSRSNPFHLNYVKLTDLSCSNHSCDEVCSLYLLDLMSQNETSPLPLELGLLPLRELIPTTDDDSQPSGLTLYDLALSHKNLEQLFRNILGSVKIESVKLSNLSCRDHPCSESRCLSELDLQSHHMLFSLRLCQVPLKGLILPSHDLSPLCQLRLCDLVLTHKSIEQAFTFCKYPSGRYYPNCVELSNLSCSDHLCSGACSVLDLEFNSILVKLKLCKLPISELILPRERVVGSLELFDLALTHKSLEHICSSLSCPSDLRHVKLINLLCRDHSSKNKCSLSLLDLHTQHHLESLQLTKITVEGLLLPTKNSEMLRSRNLTKKTFIHLEDTNMSLEGWRNFIDALLHTENDCKVKVILTSCNIDSDTRMLISDSLQFRVVRNDDSLVKIELVNSDTHSDSEPEDCTGDKQDWQFY